MKLLQGFGDSDCGGVVGSGGWVVGFVEGVVGSDCSGGGVLKGGGVVGRNGENVAGLSVN